VTTRPGDSAESSPFKMEDTEKTGAAPGTRLSLAGPVGGPRTRIITRPSRCGPAAGGGRGSTVQVTVPGNSDQGASAAVISGEAPGRHRAQDPEPGAGPGRSGGRTRCSKTPTA